MNDVNIIGIPVKLISDLSRLVKITSESFNHREHQAEQRKLVAEPQDQSMDDLGDNEATRLEPPIEQEKDVSSNRDPGNRVHDVAKHPVFELAVKYLEPKR